MTQKATPEKAATALRQAAEARTIASRPENRPAVASSLASKNRDPFLLEQALEKPLQFQKGIGPYKAELLEKLGLRTVGDLLFHFPRDHQDRRILPIREASPGAKKAFQGEILSVDFRQVGKMLGQARAAVRDSTGVLEAVWFKYLSFRYDVFSGLKRDLVAGKRIALFGSIEASRDGVELRVEEYEMLENGRESSFNGITPIYPLTKGLQDKALRQWVARILEEHLSYVVDPLPEHLRAGHKLLPLSNAIRQYHFPKNLTERDRARHRLAFDEFFFLEMALASNRQNRHQTKGFQCQPKKHLLTPFKNHLGYEFTRAQVKCINEIFRDMAQPFPMNRLLQGDVGSGKTVVALSASLLAIENDRQVAFLAPTEILAGQHALSIEKFFSPLPVRGALLTGSTPSRERQRILKGLETGDLHYVIGTHAILNEKVRFKRLGLVVIDEQHRFGVRQRAQLVAKNDDSANTGGFFNQNSYPDVLIMTATPIPRTLALTLYGDLEVSVIDALPAGRTPVKTACSTEEKAMNRIAAELKEGHQAYVVFPLVGESESLAKKNKKVIRAATLEFEKLKAAFPGYKVGLLHGQMPSEEKTEVMDRFRKREISILVATPVIEVGIDVANATTITIMNPERFGLAQLHQLRGRVGRGPFPSECLLVVESMDQPVPDRLSIFCAISDGFWLAEEDLRLRGPGEFVGEAQHGVPFFKVGSLIDDGLLIAEARLAADGLVKGQFHLTMREFGLLNRTLLKKFGKKMQLSRVG